MDTLTELEKKDYEYIIDVITEQINKMERENNTQDLVLELEPPKGKQFISDPLLAKLCLFTYRGYFCVPEISNRNILNVIKQKEKTV